MIYYITYYIFEPIYYHENQVSKSNKPSVECSLENYVKKMEEERIRLENMNKKPEKKKYRCF